jgi:TRAP-type C4-dicarboxylate transport system substrate-binding protein
MKTIVKKTALLLSLLLIASLLFVGCGKSSTDGTNGNASPETTIELKVAHHVPAESIEGKAIADWAARIEEKSDGKVKFVIYPGASLGEAKNSVDMTKSGITDIAFSFYGFFPSTFPMTEAVALPMSGIKTATQANLVAWDLYSNYDYLEKEWSSVKLLGFFCHGPAIICTKDISVQSADDLKGLNLRVVAGPPTEILQDLGAVPMNIPTSEVYTSLEKNVINGYVFEWLGVKAWNLADQTDYILQANLYVGPWFAIMNPDKWNSLPDDIKAIFEEESGESLALTNGAIWDNAQKDLISEFEGSGIKIQTLSDEEAAKWTETGKQVAQSWIDTNKANGYPAQEVYDTVQELIQKYEGK